MAARRLGQEGAAPALPEIQTALLVEEFGTGVLGPYPDFFDLIRIREILHVRDVFKVAGTKQQKQLTGREWEMVRDLNYLAAQEAQGNGE